MAGYYDYDSDQGLTPYQGPYRRWGEFCCPECSKEWSSGNSWANKGQKCWECQIMVYPHIQHDDDDDWSDIYPEDDREIYLKYYYQEEYESSYESDDEDNDDEYEPLTKYQGTKRMWGEFQCPDCYKKWSSGNSWANTGQECRDCLIMVYPYVQRPLKFNKTVDRKKPHPEELCGKCQELGYSCRNLISTEYD